MTTEDRRLKRIGTQISRLLDKALEPYAGRNVQLFFEPESGSIFIMDADHPHFINSDKVNMGERQEAVIGRVPVVVSCPFDAGAW